MRTGTGLNQRVLVLVGFGIAIAMSVLVAAPVYTTLPEPTVKTFQTAFPQGKVITVHMRIEDGVTLYEAHFIDGGIEKVCSIAADGTMLEAGPLVQSKEVPEAALKAIKDAAAGNTIVEVEKLDVMADTDNGKTMKLPASHTEYQAVLAKLGALGYVSVTPDGKVVEPLQWETQPTLP